jgi:hypothetical protein
MYNINHALNKMNNKLFKNTYYGDIKYFYYKHLYINSILKTNSIFLNSECNLDLHTLTCQKDFINTIWSLKSFYNFAEIRPRLVVYNDGSLTNDSKKIFYDHFLNCEIIDREDFNYDMEKFLKSYKSCLKYVKFKSFYCALKLFGPMFYTRSDYILYFDSDVLFFNKPSELLECIENRTPFFMSDYQDAYSHSLEFLERMINFHIISKVNAGLFHVAKRDFVDNMELVDSYLRKVPEIGSNDRRVNRHEQTLVAILLSKANGVRLGHDYQISKQPVTDKTVCHHFVNDGSRPDFYRIGLRRLRSAGFVEEFSTRRSF